MKDARRSRIWTLAGVFALALTAGVAARRNLQKRAPREPAAPFAGGEDLRDAVASPAPPATAGLGGRPVPTSWFKTSAQSRVEMDSALLSSRRRALARRGSVQSK
jgi:hypothetical protein